MKYRPAPKYPVSLRSYGNRKNTLVLTGIESYGLRFHQLDSNIKVPLSC